MAGLSKRFFRLESRVKRVVQGPPLDLDSLMAIIAKKGVPQSVVWKGMRVKQRRGVEAVEPLLRNLSLSSRFGQIL
jgi:hypothetical protein